LEARCGAEAGTGSRRLGVGPNSGALFGGAGEENEISVGIFDDEGGGSPGFLLERLLHWSSGGFAGLVKLFCFCCGSESERSGKEAFAVPYSSDEDWPLHATQREAGAVTNYERIERRISVHELDGEAELVFIERAGRSDVGDEELGFGGGEHRPWRVGFGVVGHAIEEEKV
jgi:hypothetical protein